LSTADLPGLPIDSPGAEEPFDFFSSPPLTTFVGRDDELEELRSVFRKGGRLVTLTGIGGIGKTRLAVELFSEAAELNWPKAYFVQLGSLTNSMSVQRAVLEALGGAVYSNRSPLEAAADRLQPAPALLVLDCCEHVSEAARQVAEILLHRCPSLAVLSTSRSPLGVAGEVVWRVRPLAMHRPAGQSWTEVSDAALLFVDRAQHLYPQFRLTEEVSATVENIARRVDGIPLAIELAASRVRVLSPKEIASGLEDHLGLLRGRQRASDPRHQTMRASLDWSYGLLTDDLHAFFARLSVFAGSFDLQAATALCAETPGEQGEVLDNLEALIDSSLLFVEHGKDVSRFRLLDFVRQYAVELLTDPVERSLLAQRHRIYYKELAQQADREIWALNPVGRARLDDESSNLHAAIEDGCLRAPEDALAIVGALSLYWRVRGRLGEGLVATDRSLGCPQPSPSAERALALASLSTMSFWFGDFSRTMTSAVDAVEMGKAVGDPRSQAQALSALGNLTILGDPGTGDELLEQAVGLARTAGDEVALCNALVAQGVSYHFHDDPDAMRIPVEEALCGAEAINYEDNIRWCLWCLSHGALAAGELAVAREHGERSLAMMKGEDPLCHYCAIEVVSILDATTGAVDTARERALGALEPSRTEGLRLGTGVLMHALGVAALAGGDLDEARYWASSLYEQEPDVLYLGWHAQEILAAEALARDDSRRAKIHLDLLAMIAARLGNQRAGAIAQLGLSRSSLLEGDDQRAERLAHEAMNVLAKRGWSVQTIDALEVLAEIAIFHGQYERGLRLVGAARSERERRGLTPIPTVRHRIERQFAGARDAIGNEALSSALGEGARLSVEEAVTYARRARGDHTKATHGWASLSPAEKQVAEHAARGMSNPEIAVELFMARDTVKAHLSHVYAKLGIANRNQLGLFVTDQTKNDL
jgi:predicted ATPase/DNA-binding CsgD family transcriptional regulator